MKSRPNKRSITVFLDEEDYQVLSRKCQERKQSRADFLRSAVRNSDRVPFLNTRPLTGACLARHLAHLKMERKTDEGRMK